MPMPDAWRIIEKKWVKAVVNPFKFKKKVEKKEKIKKKKKKKNEKRKKNRGSSGCLLMGDDTIECEILSRLPVESLMRFKCVCKRWRSLIQQDPYFIDLHLTRSKTRPPSLLIVVPKPLPIPPRPPPGAGWAGELNFHARDFYLTADLFCEGRTTTSVSASITTICKASSWFYDSISKPINGLFCLIDTQIYFAVRICNIGTREATPWIKSTLVMKEIEKHGKIIDRYRSMGKYQFGFDPVTNEHKLVCVWRISKRDLTRDYYVCEVMTVGKGNNAWRRIEEVPPYQVEEASVYVNGSIYWITRKVLRLDWDNNNPAFVVAFDIGSEKFRAIPLPNFILNQSPNYYDGLDRYVDLLEVDGRVALLIRMSGYIVKLWMFDDDDNKASSSSTTTTTTSAATSNQQNWTEVTIALPFCWEGDRSLCFHTIEGIDDQIILRTYEYSGDDIEEVTMKQTVSFYSYNWKKNSLTEFEIRGIPSSIPNLLSATLFATFVETLLPIQK